VGDGASVDTLRSLSIAQLSKVRSTSRILFGPDSGTGESWLRHDNENGSVDKKKIGWLPYCETSEKEGL
jgi:hypothetical protein